MLRFLRKDYNKSSPYNGGIVMMRIAAALLLAAVLALAWRLSYDPPALTPMGVQELVVEHRSEFKTEVPTRYLTFRNTYYTVKVHNIDSDEHYSQMVTDAEYSILKEGQSFRRPVFETDSGHFVSWDGIESAEEAAKVYYSRFPNSEIVSRNILVIIMLALTVLNAVIGIVCIVSGGRKTRETAVVLSKGFEALFDDKTDTLSRRR